MPTNRDEYIYRYVTEADGTLPGASFRDQTEDFLNALDTDISGADGDASAAMQKATDALAAAEAAQGAIAALDQNCLHKSGNETATGTKTFEKIIVGDFSGDLAGATVIANGAVASRKLGDRFADIINVKDFGAKGDGVTDDTASWTAWLAALESGGMGYVPSGTYLVNGAAKSFPSGCIGKYGDGFTSLLPGYTDRFSNAIPVGQAHIIKHERSLTVTNAEEGTHIYPSVSIDTIINVPSSATPVTLNGQPTGTLIPSCNGIYLQHILTGGNDDNKLSTTNIVTNSINDAKGDNDCSGVAARAVKTINAGIGDTAGLGGRVDDYSHLSGGVMGAEMVAYNHAGGIPCPSDFDDVSTSRWLTPLHIYATGRHHAASDAAPDGYPASPVTAGILIQGDRLSAAYWDGIQFSWSMFSAQKAEIDPAGNYTPVLKNEIYSNDGTTSEDFPGVNVPYQRYKFDPSNVSNSNNLYIFAPGEPDDTPTTETIDGKEVEVYPDGKTRRFRIPGTVAINMGSFSYTNGFPDTCIKMGKAIQHIWTPSQYFTVRARGIDVGAAASVGFRAVAWDTDQTQANPVYSNTVFDWCHKRRDIHLLGSGDDQINEGQKVKVDASLYYRPTNGNVELHNFALNTGLVFLTKGLTSTTLEDVDRYDPEEEAAVPTVPDYKKINSVAYFMPGLCTDWETTTIDPETGDEVHPTAVCKINLGSSSRRWENIYAATSSFSDSDERIKQDITAFPDAVLDAWGRVDFKQFKFIEAVRNKGAAARLHSGVIAQQVVAAFEAEGLDAFAYGIIGHDIYPAKAAVWREYDIEHQPERDEDGNITQEAWTEHVRELAEPAEPATDIYFIRYEEALAMEAAYQRRRADRLEARLEAIETRLAALGNA